MNDVIAKMVEEDPESEDGKRKIQKLVDRDVKKLRNDVERQAEFSQNLFEIQNKHNG